jgi:hypothetical protein
VRSEADIRTERAALNRFQEVYDDVSEKLPSGQPLMPQTVLLGEEELAWVLEERPRPPSKGLYAALWAELDAAQRQSMADGVDSRDEAVNVSDCGFPLDSTGGMQSA